VFFDPEITEEFNQELEGSFEGIGAEIAIKKDRLTIVSPLEGSPAKAAGLRSGDKVYAIDGEDTAGISLDQAVNNIRGPKGSEVVLSVSRDGIEEVEDVTITRDTIKIQSVKWEMKGDIAYINLSYFHTDTEDAFSKAVGEIVAKNPKGIILDMRGNPGGLLDAAIDVASEWVEDGVITYEKTSDGKLHKHSATGKARLKDFNTIVLINKGSASGSEIVAGALKDHGKAQLLGETSFGKGSVQTLFSLPDGSSIKLTIAKWLTPNENMIDQEGIHPDIEIERTDEDFDNDADPQLDKALELLNSK
jgi:carboxyl-terminal processing protease